MAQGLGLWYQQKTAFTLANGAEYCYKRCSIRKPYAAVLTSGPRVELSCAIYSNISKTIFKSYYHFYNALIYSFCNVFYILECKILLLVSGTHSEALHGGSEIERLQMCVLHDSAMCTR